MAPKYAQFLIPGTVGAVCIMWQQDLFQCDSVKDLETGRLSWTIQIDPISL